MIELICASHDEKILQANLMRSPIVKKYPLTVQRGYNNVARAYNETIPAADIVIYVHHDVYLPEGFEEDLLSTYHQLDALGLMGSIGVLGVAGVTAGRKIHGHINDRGKEWGSAERLPHQVETLDELLLITHGDLIFDENLPLHFYGADICMQAKMQGLTNFAIDAYCHHNSGLLPGYRSQSFHECREYFRKKYINYLPIPTTCTIVT